MKAFTIISMFLSLLFAGLSLLAQPVIQIKQDRDVFNIAGSIHFFVDESDTNSIKDFLQPGKENMFSGNDPNIGVTEAALWCKFRVGNKTAQDCYLEIANTSLDSISIFEVLADHSFIERRSGAYINYDSRELRNNNYLFRLCGRTDEPKTFYLRVRHSRGTQFPAYVGTLQGFMEHFHNEDLIMGIYFGFMLLMIFYNLFIYSSVRDSSYLYYVVYVSCMTLLNASLSGYAFEYLWSRQAWLNRYEDLVSASVGIAGILFATNFLHTKQKTPTIHKIFNILLILLSLGFVMVLLGNFMAGSMFIEIITLILIIVFIIAANMVWRGGFVPAKFFLIAWSVLLLAAVVFVLKDFNLLPYNVFTVHSLTIGSACEAFLLLFALANRLSAYKKEKEDAQLQVLNSLLENEKLIRGQNILLESKVEERTKELKLEKQKSDELLLNILPLDTAEELKATGKAEAKNFEQVTVMFTDFANFTQASQKMSAQELVSEIDFCYCEFDKIISRHNIEKIKTIGDSYMCAGGLPIKNNTHPLDVVSAA